MPRRRPDPNSYVFTKSGGVITDCRFRNFSKPCRKIPIHFTAASLKVYRNIKVNTPSEEAMSAFLHKLNSMGQRLGLADLEFELILVRPYLECKQEEEVDEVNRLWSCASFPKYEVHPAIAASKSVIVQIELVDNDLHRQFMDLWKEEFGFYPNENTKSFWFPSKALEEETNKWVFVDGAEPVMPKYPIYIISKGRWESRLTSKFLDRIQVPYFMVVEEGERQNYEDAGVSPDKLLVLSKVTVDGSDADRNAYDEEHANDGASVPARNFAWYHSKYILGSTRHWILDDNIRDYCRMYRSQRLLVNSGACFRVVEDFVDQFDNVLVAGHQYTTFNIPQNGVPPISLNTRAYSSILLHNDAFPKYAWRGMYNEDTDLSLRVMKDGFPTVLCNAFLASKQTTLRMQGGNTDVLYTMQNALEQKADSLVKSHPDVSRIVERFGRVHHLVDYTPFRHLRPNLVQRNVVADQEYGLTLKLAEEVVVVVCKKKRCATDPEEDVITLSNGETIPRANKRCFRETTTGGRKVVTHKVSSNQMPVPKCLRTLPSS